MRIPLLALLATLIFGCQLPEVKSTFPEGKWVDLTYPFDENTIYWPTAENFSLDTVFAGETEKGYYYSAFQYCAAEHGGTHLDAPVHFAESKQTVDQIPLDRLIGEGIVIDVSENALPDPDYLVTVTDFQNWEKTNGQIPEDAIVLLRTGYGKYWPDRVKYMGTAERGDSAVAKLHFPGLAPEAAEWIVANRKIKAIGMDTPSIDYGQSTLFESHQILFKENIPAFENVANLDQLPLKGMYIIALPMQVKNGSGAPLRIIANIAN